MQTPPLLNEQQEQITTYDRFSQVTFNNRLGANPIVIIKKDTVTTLDDKAVKTKSKTLMKALTEENKDRVFQVDEQLSLSYEQIFSILYAFCIHVDTFVEPVIDGEPDRE
jgi:hypothetical protein